MEWNFPFEVGWLTLTPLWSICLQIEQPTFLFWLCLITIYAVFPQNTNETRILNMKWAWSSNKSDWTVLCEEVKCWQEFSCCWRSKTGCYSKGFYSFIIQNVGRNSNSNTNLILILYWYFVSILEIMGFNVRAAFLILSSSLWVDLNQILVIREGIFSWWKLIHPVQPVRYNEKCNQNCYDKSVNLSMQWASKTSWCTHKLSFLSVSLHRITS